MAQFLTRHSIPGDDSRRPHFDDPAQPLIAPRA
jgi:hypothetical protein